MYKTYNLKKQAASEQNDLSGKYSNLFPEDAQVETRPYTD
jgi:hypothetical protein